MDDRTPRCLLKGVIDARFYGYKHWTLEETPRCFYVGKGASDRPYESGKMRNHKWRAVSNRYGLCVEICMGPVEHDEALAWELEWVAKENTFSTNHSHDDPTDIGCNFTRGGHGAVGFKHSEETRKLLSEKARKRPPPTQAQREQIRRTLQARPSELNPFYGKHHTEETCGKMRSAWEKRTKRTPTNKGVPMSEDAKANLRGRKMTDEQRQKCSEAHKGKPTWNKGKCGMYSEETIAKIKAARARQTERRHAQKQGKDGSTCD